MKKDRCEIERELRLLMIRYAEERYMPVMRPKENKYEQKEKGDSRKSHQEPTK